jgi:hypothetical protein
MLLTALIGCLCIFVASIVGHIIVCLWLLNKLDAQSVAYQGGQNATLEKLEGAYKASLDRLEGQHKDTLNSVVQVAANSLEAVRQVSETVVSAKSATDAAQANDIRQHTSLNLQAIREGLANSVPIVDTGDDNLPPGAFEIKDGESTRVIAPII